MLAGVRCGTFGFEVIFGVAESASDRAGSGLVGTTSGLPMATEAGLVVPNLALTGIGAVTTSAVNSISGRETTSGRDSGSGLSAEPRHSRTCDRSTMELVVSARLSSAERVATGVGSSSQGAGTETDSLTGCLRLSTLRSEFSIIYTYAP